MKIIAAGRAGPCHLTNYKKTSYFRLAAKGPGARRGDLSRPAASNKNFIQKIFDHAKKF
jgi:hypothetical protein